MVTIEALKHLKSKFETRANIAVTPRDKQAVNVLIEFYNNTVKNNNGSYKLFIKLFVNEFLRETVIYRKGTRMALENIEDMLSIPVEDYFDMISNESIWESFRKKIEEIEYIPKEELSDHPVDRNIQEKHNKAIIEANHGELCNMLLTSKFTPEQAKRWLHRHVHELIIEYSKWD